MMGYLVSIYGAMVKAGRRQVAFEWYQENYVFYHPIARN